MLGKIPFTYNGFTLNTQSTSWAALTQVTGLSDIQLRHTRRDKTGDHGIQDYDTFAGSRVITFEGILISDSEVNMAALLDSFRLAFVIESNPTPTDTGEHILTWQDVGEVAKQITAKIERCPVITETMHGYLNRDFLVSLVAADPRIISQTTQSAIAELAFPSGLLTFPLTFPLDFSAGYANEEVCTNAGNFSAAATITITCPTGYTIEDPRIDNATTGAHVEFSGLTLEEDDILTITPNSADWYDSSTGITTDVLGYLTASSTSIYIKPGANTLRFTDTDSDPTSPTYTYLTGSYHSITAAIAWRDTWI